MPKGICRVSSAAAITVSVTGFAFAQDVSATYSLYGTPGLLEMPTAQSAPENEVASTLALTKDYTRIALSFQLTNRLSGTFRFSRADFYDDPAGTGTTLATERGLDLRYRLNNETAYLPAVAIGLQDIFTPGAFGAEYVVASKSFGDNLIATVGLGWGKFGTRDGFANPLGSSLGTRPTYDPADPDGQLASNQWFRGDAAVFGGVEYQINDRWGVKAEYSSNAYDAAPNAPALNVEQPYNLGLTYRPTDGVQFGLSYLYGTQIGLSGSFLLNPTNRPGMSGTEKAPAPVRVRSGDAAAARTWDRAAVPEPALRTALAELLKIEGLTLTALEITDQTARVRYTNGRYRSQAQAAGRVARMMTQVMPASVETFILEPEARGIPLSSTTIARSDLERLENQPGSTDAIFASARFSDAGAPAGLVELPSTAPAFSWGLGPYFRLNPFSSDGTIDVDTGLTLRGAYTIQPNLVVMGAIEQSVLKPDPDPTDPDPTPEIQNVRTDGSSYGNDGVPVLDNLTLSYFMRPGDDLYGRVSLGYLESMFGGVSGELLWKPVNSRLGLGIEVNQVGQRNTDMWFGFDEYDYQVTTGHLSAYYDFGNGYHGQLDAGRYLAGDWGATVSIDREFDNGWVLGAYFTQTDMDYSDFGDGSYNKGIRITVPQDFLTGSPSRGTYGTTFASRIGDGGARLRVNGRLYDVVRDGHTADLSDTWGRFWR